MVAGTPPILAKKARYYEDARLQERILPPPVLTKPKNARPDDWSALPLPPHLEIEEQEPRDARDNDDDPTDSERRHQPELNKAKTVEKKEPIDNEFSPDPADDMEDDTARISRMDRTMRQIARQASLDPGDGVDL